MCICLLVFAKIPSSKKDSKAQVIIDDPRALCTMHSSIAAHKTRTSMDMSRFQYLKICVELHEVASCKRCRKMRDPYKTLLLFPSVQHCIIGKIEKLKVGAANG